MSEPCEISQSSIKSKAVQAMLSSPRKGFGKRRQLIAMQHALFDVVLNPNVKASERAQAACAWERLENRLNRMRMKPEPKPIDTTKTAKARSKPAPGGFDPTVAA